MRSKIRTVSGLTTAFAVAVSLVPSLSAQQMASNNPNPQLLNELTYRMVGPTRGGRVTAVAGHRAHPSTFYMGATGGGVWKTDDWGNTWLPIADDYLETGSIGAITVAPSDPSTVYVGTGSDGLRSNVIVGKGMYRSTDAGQSWQKSGLDNAGQIGAVIVHPTNARLVYAAAIGDPFAKNDMRGVFRSANGGDSWERWSSLPPIPSEPSTWSSTLPTRMSSTPECGVGSVSPGPSFPACRSRVVRTGSGAPRTPGTLGSMSHSGCPRG